jgi:hypothetical protein
MARIRNVAGGGERDVSDAVARVVVGQGRAVYADTDAEVEVEAAVEVEAGVSNVTSNSSELTVVAGVSNVADLIAALDAGTLDPVEAANAELDRPDGGRKTMLAYFGITDQPDDEPDEYEPFQED